MKRAWQLTGSLIAGLLMSASYALPQAYTVSAKPGALNYIEGNASLNGKALSDKGLRSTFLNVNDTLSTDIGKAEVLLTPGVFLRIGDNTQIRMISPSLTDTQVEVNRGEAMIEADGLLKENHLTVIDHGATITIDRNGLYRFTADAQPTAAVIDGKALVYFGEKKIELGKGHETLLADNSKPDKFDSKREDELYAWSNVRSQYDAAASYRSAQTVASNNYGGWAGYGFADWYGAGWYWDPMFSGWGWLPAYGAFYSPFGWGFYAPAVVGYAPIVTAPVYSGGGWTNKGGTGTNGTGTTGTSGTGTTHRWNPIGSGVRAAVPVNPNNPPALGTVAASPFANQVAQSYAAQSFAYTGFHTATGAPVAAFSGHASYAGTGASHASGGWSGGGAAAMSAGGGHVGSVGGGGGASHK